MKRRKFLVGLGSLAAGASVAMGTGAISETAIDRKLRGRVAADANAYVKITGDGQNGDKVEVDNGEVVIDLDTPQGGNHPNGGPQGTGLNADSMNYFDGLLYVEIQDIDNGFPVDGDDYQLWIEENTAANGRLDFYRASQRTNSIVGQAQATNMGTNDWENVGMSVNLNDSGLEAGDPISQLFGAPKDLFTIHVEKV